MKSEAKTILTVAFLVIMIVSATAVIVSSLTEKKPSKEKEPSEVIDYSTQEVEIVDAEKVMEENKVKIYTYGEDPNFEYLPYEHIDSLDITDEMLADNEKVYFMVFDFHKRAKVSDAQITELMTRAKESNNLYIEYFGTDKLEKFVSAANEKFDIDSKTISFGYVKSEGTSTVEEGFWTTDDEDAGESLQDKILSMVAK